MKLKLTKIKHTSFEGFVRYTDLSQEQKDQLKLEQDNVVPIYVMVEGEITVNWDIDTPMAELTDLIAVGSQTGSKRKVAVGTEKSVCPTSGCTIIRAV